MGHLARAQTYLFYMFVIDLVIELRMQREWNNDLDDKKSEAFKELSFQVEQEVTSYYNVHVLHACNREGPSNEGDEGIFLSRQFK